MKKMYLRCCLAIMSLSAFFTANAQVSFTGAAYTQNFNTLATSGSANAWSNNSTIPGWFLYNQAAGGTAITAYGTDNAAGTNTGSFFSYGSIANAERALGGTASGGVYFGSPASGAIAGWIAAAFTNNTGADINSVTLGFNGEQWRNGGNATAQTMVLEYGFGTSFTTVSAWTAPGGNFNWTSPVATATAAAVDGNVAGLVSGKGGTLSALNWTNGTTLWIRWVERNDAGNDHGLAIDDFTLSTGSATPAVSLSVSSNTGTEVGTTAITVTATASAAVSGNQAVDLGISGTNITSGDYTLSNTTITILDGQTSGTATFTVADDALAEGNETAVLTISNPTAGVSLGSTTTQNIIVTDNDVPPVPAVNLSVSSNSGSEAGISIINVTATAAFAVTGNQSVNLVVSGTNITAGDYALSNTQITIPDGATTGSVTFTVVDDVISEGTETAILTINFPSAGVELGTTTTQNIAIADNDLPKIHDIQGSGSVFNPAFGGTQTIEGIVVATFPGATKLNGFYVQEEDADSDGNPATSEGIFVFDGGSLFTGTVGTKVQVTGTVSDFATTAANIAGTGNCSLTELTATSVVNLGAAPLPAITNVVLPVSNISDLEKYEGMLVNVTSTSGPLTVTETFKIGRYGQVGLSSGARIDQYTQVNAPSVTGYANFLANIQNNYIILDDGSSTQNPDPEIFARGGSPLSASNTLRGGDHVASIAGVMDQRFEGYRVQTITPVNFTAANPRLTAPPTVGGNVKAAFLNVLNFFTNLDLNTTISIPNGVSFEPRGANTAAEFTRQRDKIISAITGLNADVAGISEMENDGNTSIQNLVNGLNAVTGAGTYAFINDQALVNDPNPAINAVGTDAIKVGIIYKPAVLTPVGAASSYLEPNPASPIFSRPPIAQTFTTANGNKFSIIVNHFKSKGSANSLPGDTDQNDGQALSNATRVAQSNALLSFINTVKATSGDSDVLVVGDLNAYAMEDPITTLTGGGLTNLLPNTSYSYQFNGQWGSLDHALATTTMTTQVAGIAKWHINSDEPVVLDYNTEFKTAGQVTGFYNGDAFRSSDHDPVLIGLQLGNQLPSVTISSPVNPAFFNAGSTISVQVNATDADGSIAKTELFVNGSLLLTDSVAPYIFTASNVEPGVYKVTVKATDNSGGFKVSDTLVVTVTACTGSGSITGEGYTNIPGTQVADLTANAAYPNSPSITASLTTFEYSNVADNYGGRVRGYFCAPVTGNYIFNIAGDDQAGLWLSTNGNPANKVLIAYTELPTAFRQWNKYSTQKSATIFLVIGGRYYIETLQKESTGSDHLSVAVTFPGGLFEGPIQGSRLSPIGSSARMVSGAQAFATAMESRTTTGLGSLKVTVAPNPATDYFSLKTSSSNTGKLGVKVTDATGRVVESKVDIAANGTIRIGDKLPAGIYFAEVRQGNQKQIIKLVKQ